MNKEILFSYTKFSENHIKDIFHVNLAEQPSEGEGRDPQLLRGQFLALSQFLYAAT